MLDLAYYTPITVPKPIPRLWKPERSVDQRSVKNGTITSKNNVWAVSLYPGDRPTYWVIIESIKETPYGRYKYILQQISDEGEFLSDVKEGYVTTEQYVNPKSFKQCKIIQGT